MPNRVEWQHNDGANLGMWQDAAIERSYVRDLQWGEIFFRSKLIFKEFLTTNYKVFQLFRKPNRLFWAMIWGLMYSQKEDSVGCQSGFHLVSVRSPLGVREDTFGSLIVTKFRELIGRALQIWRADIDSSPN